MKKEADPIKEQIKESLYELFSTVQSRVPQIKPKEFGIVLSALICHPKFEEALKRLQLLDFERRLFDRVENYDMRSYTISRLMTEAAADIAAGLYNENGKVNTKKQIIRGEHLMDANELNKQEQRVVRGRELQGEIATLDKVISRVNTGVGYEIGIYTADIVSSNGKEDRREIKFRLPHHDIYDKDVEFGNIRRAIYDYLFNLKWKAEEELRNL